MAAVLFARLVVYALLLAPWFLMAGHAYFTTPWVIRGIRYGPNARNYLDIYCPVGVGADSDRQVPVVVAVMGGAWVIGHRLWSCVLGSRLAEAGIMVVAVDYRNFPCAQVHDMVEDVGTAMDWVFANIRTYGGDAKNMALVAQSAGAHLQAMLLLDRCISESNGKVPAAGWSVSDLKGFVGVSGAYDLLQLEPHLQARGLYPFVRQICAQGDMVRCSPTHRLKGAVAPAAAALLPPVKLFHGEDDNSVPVASSLDFAKSLRSAGAQSVTVEIRPGMRHVEPVVEDPLTGGDLQVQLLLPLLLGEEESKRRLASLRPPRPRAPTRFVNAVSLIMPF